MTQSNIKTSRERLPNRRPSIPFDLDQAGLRFTCTYSEFADGRLADVFLQNHKPGSQADMNARATPQSLQVWRSSSVVRLRTYRAHCVTTQARWLPSM